MTNETDKHTLHRLYFLGIRKKTLTQPRKDLKEVKHKKIIKTQKSIKILTGLDAPTNFPF